MRHIFGILDNCGGSFKEYFLQNNMPEKIKRLKHNLDTHSCSIIDKCLFRMLHLPDASFVDRFYIDDCDFIKWIETPEETFYRQSYEYSIEKFKNIFDLDGEPYNPDTFLFEHGLLFANSMIKNYIKHKIFIDGGAFIGDSVLILSKYSPKKIISFDLSSKNIEKYHRVMQINNINPDTYEIHKIGLSDKSGQITFNEIEGQGSSLIFSGSDPISITSIDEFSSSLNDPIGFIKADLEGNGLKALNGMANTIQKDRPVLSLAIYHSPEEFFEMKPRLEEIVKDISYKLTVKHFHCFCDFLAEIAIFAFPQELFIQEDVDDRFLRLSHHPLFPVINNIINIE